MVLLWKPILLRAGANGVGVLEIEGSANIRLTGACFQVLVSARQVLKQTMHRSTLHFEQQRHF